VQKLREHLEATLCGGFFLPFLPMVSAPIQCEMQVRKAKDAT
jgi:hypothetical protein